MSETNGHPAPFPRKAPEPRSRPEPTRRIVVAVEDGDVLLEMVEATDAELIAECGKRGIAAFNARVPTKEATSEFQRAHPFVGAPSSAPAVSWEAGNPERDPRLRYADAVQDEEKTVADTEPPPVGHGSGGIFAASADAVDAFHAEHGWMADPPDGRSTTKTSDWLRTRADQYRTGARTGRDKTLPSDFWYAVFDWLDGEGPERGAP